MERMFIVVGYSICVNILQSAIIWIDLQAVLLERLEFVGVDLDSISFGICIPVLEEIPVRPFRFVTRKLRIYWVSIESEDCRVTC